MKLRGGSAWVWIGLVACVGCDGPRMIPVMPPGVKPPRVAPPTSGSGADAIGETGNVGGSAQPTVPIAEPTPVGQEKKTASGMTYITNQEGTGPMAKPGQTVTISYAGRLENGTKFYSTADKGGPEDVVVGAGRNLKGMDEGIPGMKVGEKRRLIIPGHMGYGAAGQPPTIPPNATLIIDVELPGEIASAGPSPRLCRLGRCTAPARPITGNRPGPSVVTR